MAAGELVPDSAPRVGLGFFEQGQTCGEDAVGFGFAELLGGLEQCKKEGFLGGADTDNPGGHTRLMPALRQTAFCRETAQLICAPIVRQRRAWSIQKARMPGSSAEEDPNPPTLSPCQLCTGRRPHRTGEGGR